jgi:hypothetical protein
MMGFAFALRSRYWKAIENRKDAGPVPQLRFTFEIDKKQPSDGYPLFDHHPSERDRRKARPIPGSK